MPNPKKWTVVQHSAWAANRDPQFKHALESASISAEVAEKVTEAGGLVFDDYTEAEDYAEREQYPPQVTGLIGHAPGTFASMQVGGRALYVPPARLTDREALDFAIFALNTGMDPDASDAKDVTEMEARHEEIVARLSAIRDNLKKD